MVTCSFHASSFIPIEDTASLPRKTEVHCLKPTLKLVTQFPTVMMNAMYNELLQNSAGLVKVKAILLRGRGGP
jgi:hypothetical protein